MKNFLHKTLQKIIQVFQPEETTGGRPKRKHPSHEIPAAKPQRAASNPDHPKQRTPGRPSRSKSGLRRRTETSQAASAQEAPQKQWSVSQFNVPPLEGKTRFHDLNLPEALLHAINDLGFLYCTPIQAEILPSTLSGKDATGRAQTGTGKTAAFLITVINRIVTNPVAEKPKPGTPRVLILAPTRELVLQITEEARQLSKYYELKIVSVFGGMDYEKQRKQLTAGPVDIIVATPGRLLDFQRQRDLSLKKIEVLIIDEADRMLDMGFIPDVRKIIYSTPPKTKRQTLLFSATLTGEVTRFASQWTREPVSVEIEPEQIAVDTVDQIVYIVTTREKFALLYNIIDKQKLERVLVFCNRRDEVRRLADMLTRYGINCSELSGDVPQKKRIQRLEQFKAGRIRVLVATDVAGRGIHIEGMDHVFNFSLPRDPEDYVHRIGRTGRAGASGTSVSFADEEDAFYIPPIEEFIERELSCIAPNEEWLSLPEPLPEKKNRRPSRRRRTAAVKPENSRRRARSSKRPSRLKRMSTEKKSVSGQRP